MKRIDKEECPALLSEFIEEFPYVVGKHAVLWNKLRDHPLYQCEVVDRLLFDQGHLCAYCENSIYRATGEEGLQDIGVEHFHPKSSAQDDHHWVTDWANLFAVCLGGSNPYVLEPNLRCGGVGVDGTRKAELTCDKRKGEDVLDDLILKPTQIPTELNLFRVSRSTGEISVHEPNCESLGVDPEKVSRTIDKLNLNANRLCLARKGILGNVSKKMVELRRSMTVSEAARKISNVRFKASGGRLYPFYTACRAFLGRAADDVINGGA